MADHELTRLQKNEVLQAIREAALDPADFRWTEEHTRATALGSGSETLYVEALLHEQSGGAFAFDIDMNRRGQHWGIFHPGREGPTEAVAAGDWHSQMALVRTWLDLVKQEYEAPDLWAEVGRERELISATGPTGPVGDTRFTPEEREEIATQLREIRELIVGTAALTAGEIEQLDERLEYVEAAAHRLSRRDWAGIFLSTIFSYAIEHALGSPLVTEVLRLAGHGLGHLFGAGGFPELPGGPIGPV